MTKSIFFMTRKMYRYAGEAFYILGAHDNWRGQDASAMQYLKKAEQCWKQIPPEEESIEDASMDILSGMTYYKMGRISENEQLYEVASHYYGQAAPYIVRADLPLYAACVYREMARTSTDTASQRTFFEAALAYADRLDTLTYLDIRHSALSRMNPDSKELKSISRYLCDSAGQNRYAYDIVRYYLQEDKLDSAAIYLHVLAADTANLNWSADKYAFLLSRYQSAIGSDAAAYRTLLSLYNKQSGEIEATGMTRTFTISERYDNALEREKNLQLQLEKQQLYVLLVGLLAFVLVLAIVMIVLYSRRRARMLVEKAESEAKIAGLNAELTLRRESMQRMLQQRILLSKNLQESIVRHREEEVPAWAKEFVETNIFTTEEQWITFREEFDSNYNNLLSRLKKEHPALTPADMQVMALSILGLDISDICLLLNLTKRTIWSRRLRIKVHLGLSAGDQLDEWLQERAKE